MKSSKNVDKYKAKIIELADKLLEKEKECDYLKELTRVQDRRINSLEKYIDDDKRYKDLIEHIEQQDNKITSLIKERDGYKDLFESSDKLADEKQFEINNLTRKLSEILDQCLHAEKQKHNWKADCEYNEKCFQAEREARYKLEDEIRVLKGQKTYPSISLNCNDITGESSSLYFCFSYDDRVLLANNVPGNIRQDEFIIKSCYIDSSKGGLIYEIEYQLPQFVRDKFPYYICNVKFEVSYDLKKVISSCIPTCWNTYCNHKRNNDVRDSYFQRYCFLGINTRLYACVSADKFILLDMHPEDWIQKSDRWKILYDSNTKNGLVQIYDSMSVKAVTYYIEGNSVKKVINE